MLMSLAACGAGLLLDLLFGDPVWLYHPVRLIGNWISWAERQLRKVCGAHPVAVGGVLWGMTALLAFLVPFALLFLAGKIHPALGFLLETFWCFQILAARCLSAESRKVYGKLKEGDLPGARKAVSMIVGRDTENLTEEGVTKAAVETVAENTSDGVTAPLFYLLIGGVPLGFLYKAVNTMDSMLGYKNDRYLYFGRIPAKMDDVLTGLDGKNAWKIWRRDRRKHASPNAAQTESVCAGALGVRLAGDAVYFGKVYKKEFIGDARRRIEPEDILRTGRLMYATELLTFLLCGGIRLALAQDGKADVRHGIADLSPVRRDPACACPGPGMSRVPAKDGTRKDRERNRKGDRYGISGKSIGLRDPHASGAGQAVLLPATPRTVLQTNY